MSSSLSHSGAAAASTTLNTIAQMQQPSVTSRFKKNLARTKEKILQGIGKSDRTSDSHFDVYIDSFERQHTHASRLGKELTRYMACLRETHRSSRMFYEALRETYEPEWTGAGEFGEQCARIDEKWVDYLTTLTNDVHMPLQSYLNEFPELKKKIDKRGKRLLDYDEARHTLASVQTKINSSSSKSTTPTAAADQLTKLTKLKIDLEDKQHIYDEINQTLCLSLPVLYENRIQFYASLFQTFFHTETMFHSDCVDAKSRLDELCEELSRRATSLNSNSLKVIKQQEQIRELEKNMKEHLRRDQGGSDADNIHNEEEDDAIKETTSQGYGDYSESEMHLKPTIVTPDNYDDEEVDEGSDNVNKNSENDNSSDSNTQYSHVVVVSTQNNGSTNGRLTSNGGPSSMMNKSSSLQANYSSSPLSSVPQSNPNLPRQSIAEFIPPPGETKLDRANSTHNGNHPLVPPPPIPTTSASTNNLDNNRLSTISTPLSTISQLNGANSHQGVVKCQSIDKPAHNPDVSSGGVAPQMSSRLPVICPTFIYKVKATYAYKAKEVDELAFSKDDLIDVVDGTDSEKEDLDDGWLIGVHELSHKRGLFPENFTRRLQ